MREEQVVRRLAQADSGSETIRPGSSTACSQPRRRAIGCGGFHGTSDDAPRLSGSAGAAAADPTSTEEREAQEGEDWTHDRRPIAGILRRASANLRPPHS